MSEETSGQFLESMGMNGQKWAKRFMETIEREPHIIIDEGLMIGWFANAIMAGHNHRSWQLSPKIDKLKALILLVDPSVSMEEMNSLSAKQWKAYVEAFPDEVE